MVIQTCLGTVRFLCVKKQGIDPSTKSSQTQSSNRNEQMRNAIQSRVHKIAARDDFSGPVSCQKCVWWGTISEALEHQSVA